VTKRFLDGAVAGRGVSSERHGVLLLDVWCCPFLHVELHCTACAMWAAWDEIILIRLFVRVCVSLSLSVCIVCHCVCFYDRELSQREWCIGFMSRILRSADRCGRV